MARAPDNKKGVWDAQLTRMFNLDGALATGVTGFRGVTTNPPLSLQAIQADPIFWTEEIAQIIRDAPDADVEAVYWQVYLGVVRRGAAMIRSIFDRSNGKYGYVSGQVDPRFVTDGLRMFDHAMQLAALGPNVMVKIPGCKKGTR